MCDDWETGKPLWISASCPQCNDEFILMTIAIKVTSSQAESGKLCLELILCVAICKLGIITDINILKSVVQKLPEELFLVTLLYLLTLILSILYHY